MGAILGLVGWLVMFACDVMIGLKAKKAPEAGGTVPMLLCIFIPLYAWYWGFKNAEKNDTKMLAIASLGGAIFANVITRVL